MTGHTGKLSVFGPNPKWNKMTFYEKKTVVVCALLKPNSISLVGSELVRSWFEPDSVMEFGSVSYTHLTLPTNREV